MFQSHQLMKVRGRLHKHNLGSFVVDTKGLIGWDALPLITILHNTLPTQDDAEYSNEVRDSLPAEHWANTFGMSRLPDEGFTFKPPQLKVMLHVNFPQGGRLSVTDIRRFVEILFNVYAPHPENLLFGIAVQVDNTRADILFYPGGLSLQYRNREDQEDVTVYAAERGPYMSLVPSIEDTRRAYPPYAVENDQTSITQELYATTQLSELFFHPLAFIQFSPDSRDGPGQPFNYYLGVTISLGLYWINQNLLDIVDSLLQQTGHEASRQVTVAFDSVTASSISFLKAGIALTVRGERPEISCLLKVHSDIRDTVFLRFMEQLRQLLHRGDCSPFDDENHQRLLGTPCIWERAFLAFGPGPTSRKIFTLEVNIPDALLNEWSVSTSEEED
ncbi:MAG: hypothetical protein M1833_005383 [Piccolia ochrophora]|nr:MAG: hypothetical protein M1833_005383 [Piccolia ochrophora]